MATDETRTHGRQSKSFVNFSLLPFRLLSADPVDVDNE